MVVTDMAVVILAVLAVAGCVAGLVGVQRRMRVTAALQQKTEQQLQQLANTLRALEARVAEISAKMSAETAKAPAAAPKAAPVPAPAPAPVVAAAAPPKKQAEEISPELLVVMAAAVTVFLGKQVRIRSAKMLQSPYEIVNPWSQQGRVFVQASHNLRSR
jgi:outer membrane murein-binding lipoprotein Lpp